MPSRKQPPIGRQSETGIRGMLIAIRRKMAEPAITPGELLQLLKHEQRLSRELKAVVAERIRTKLAELNDSTSLNRSGDEPAREKECREK